MGSKKSLLVTLVSVSFLIGGLIFLIGRNFTTSHHTLSVQRPQLFVVGEENNSQINVTATTLPQFLINFSEQKFQNLWQAHAQERQQMVTAEVVNKSQDTLLPVSTQYNDAKKQAIFTPNTSNYLKPGLYHLSVKVKTVEGKDITITQDFTWGVLAINTSKAVYQPGETVKIGMGVLDDRGNTKCIAKGDVTYTTAKVWLSIISPSGKETDLSTDAGTIVGSSECAPTSVTNNPDFQTTFVPQELGKYTLRMTAQNINGKRSIDDFFTVSKTLPPFEILRTSYPTRIYPYGHYPVEITVVAHEDYTGDVSDYVPKNFTLSDISNSGSVQKSDTYQQIIWSVNWQKGQTYTLSYTIDFPLVSPEFYLVGPFTIGSFTEGREWQIASDAISLVQSASNVVNSGTSVNATFGSTQTGNDLVIVVCAETGSATISTMSRNGGNSWSSTNITSTPRERVSYRVIRASDSATYTCSYSSSTGVKAIQMFEYSGLATSSVRDRSSTKNGSCSSGTFTTNTITITNPVELIFVAVVATTLRNVNSHSAGFTTEFAFNGSSGTFTTADQAVSSIAGYNDTVTFSGNAGTCSGAIMSFITPINLSQNGYRFFENADSVTPGTPIDLANTDITLPVPHDPFRLRFLVDVDGTQTLGLASADLILQYAQAPTSGDCSTLADTDWNPVTSSTPIAYNVNASSGGSGVSISSSGNDPTDSGYTTVLENYYESFAGDGTDDITNNQNTISGNQAGLWDVSLIDNTSDLQSTTYCLEVVNGDGAGGVLGNLDAYRHYPKVTTFYNEVNIQGGTVINGRVTIN